MKFKKRKWVSASGRGFPKVLEKNLSQNIKRIAPAPSLALALLLTPSARKTYINIK
jgi:hypothetical protein